MAGVVPLDLKCCVFESSFPPVDVPLGKSFNSTDLRMGVGACVCVFEVL